MRHRRSPVAFTLTGVLLLAAAEQASAGPPSVPTQTAPAASAQATTFVSGPTFTLLTGDKVRLDKAADGTQQGTVVFDAGQQGDVAFQQDGKDLYAYTPASIRLIGEGKLDKQLFDLTKLAEYGYDDAHAGELPVIATYPAAKGGSRAPAATAAVPKGTRRTRVLPSVAAASLEVDKKQAAEAWTDLTRTGAPEQKVWLDGKAKASLDVSVPAIGAPQAWAAGYDGTGVKIAVLDTGIDATHPDFAGRIAASQSFVEGETTADGYGHGTHVASIVAGSGAASGGKYKGVAPGAQLIIGKVLDDGGFGTDSDIIAGMEWAAAQGADVINMSLGADVTDGTDPLSQAVNRISDASGALFVVAAGNNGAAQSVAAPGSADRALTVGAVDKRAPYGPASFTSRGPRIVDAAVKPEIAAPGVDIVAAYAKDSLLGQAEPIVDDNYLQLSGTSMATPHVAGAAAILAGKHPDWTGEQLKDALVSTANPSSAPGASIAGQGGGMVDVVRATTSPLVATGTVNLGAIEPPYAPTTGTITLRNTSDQPVHADLTLTVRQGLVGREGDTFTPPDGAVTMTPSVVDIPAGGTAAVQVSVDASKLDTITAYFGRVEARTGDTVLARSTLSWYKAPVRHRLTLKGIDRLGQPANTGTGRFQCSLLSILNLDTGQRGTGWWVDGRAYATGTGPDLVLPVGRYAVIANICTYSLQAPYEKLSETVAGEPEVVLDQDREFDFDARTATKLTYETQLPTERLGHREHVAKVARQLDIKQDDGSTLTTGIQQVSRAQDIYVIPNHTSAAEGAFYVHFSTYLVAPALTMRASSREAPLLHPWYPNEYEDEFGQNRCAPSVLCYPPFDPARTYQVVNGGDGTPAQLAAADVRGKLVLVDEVWDPAGIASPQDAPKVDQVAADAAAAGAAGVLITAAYPGTHLRQQVDRTAIPVATLPLDEGQKLAAVVATGPVSVRTGGRPISPYTYDLQYEFDRLRVPDPQVQTKDLETVNARYHSEVPGSRGVANEFATASDYYDPVAFQVTKFTTPFLRTDYYTPTSVAQSPATRAFTTPVHEYRFLVNASRQREVYEEKTGEHVAGVRLTEDYGSVPVTQGPIGDSPAMTADGDADGTNPSLTPGNIQLYRAPDGRVYSWPLTRLASRIIHDGEVLCDYPTTLGTGRGCSTPAGAGRYRYDTDVEQNVRPTMTAEHTAWDFNAKFPTDPGYDRVIPFVDLAYDIPVSLTNGVPAGRPYLATFTPSYGPGYTGTNRRFTVQAWVSSDDGATWQSAGSQATTKAGQGATFVLPAPPRDAGFVTVRVKATDPDGNAIDQTITRAWKVES